MREDREADYRTPLVITRAQPCWGFTLPAGTTGTEPSGREIIRGVEAYTYSK